MKLDFPEGQIHLSLEAQALRAKLSELLLKELAEFKPETRIEVFYALLGDTMLNFFSNYVSTENRLYIAQTLNELVFSQISDAPANPQHLN